MNFLASAGDFSEKSSSSIIHDSPRSTLQAHDNFATRPAVQAGEISTSGRVVPRADGGRDAWLFLLGCFFFEGIVWGFPFSFGVFQSHYIAITFAADPSSVPTIGTCATGIMYMLSPFMMYVLEEYPSTRKSCAVVGLVIMIASLLAASFAREVWQLILCQGVVFGVGGMALYEPTCFYLNEWFVKKKGMAFGVMWSGAGVSGLIFPFLLSWLLETYDFRTTLRIWCVFLLVVCPPLIHFIKPRLPTNTRAKKDGEQDIAKESAALSTPEPASEEQITYTFLKSPIYWILQLSNILESLGYFIPALYLPMYSTSLGYKPYIGTILLALLNISSVFGAIILGTLCDSQHISTIILISTTFSTLSVVLLWGLSTSLPALIVFAVIYGVFAGGWSAIWTGMMKEVQMKEKGAGFGVLMGLWSAGRGIGAIASGPISEKLLKAGWSYRGMGGFGTEYGVLVVFTGISALGGGVGVFSRWIGRKW